MISPHQALDRLRSGNQRFTDENSARDIIDASASVRIEQVAGRGDALGGLLQLLQDELLEALQAVAA